MTFFDNKICKIVLSTLFGGLIFGLYIFIASYSSNTYRGLYFSCIILSFIFALCFVHLNYKKITFTTALLLACCADYFLILHFSVNHNPIDQIYGMLAFCGLQVCFAVYTWFLTQQKTFKVTTIIIRVALSILIAIILPCLKLGFLEILSVIYITNFLITIVITAYHAKTEWLTLIGMISFFICDIFIGLNNGGITILGLDNLTWLSAHDYSFYFYVPGIFIIALSSVWTRNKKAA